MLHVAEAVIARVALVDPRKSGFLRGRYREILYLFSIAYSNSPPLPLT
jgi:hypothetical protein